MNLRLITAFIFILNLFTALYLLIIDFWHHIIVIPLITLPTLIFIIYLFFQLSPLTQSSKSVFKFLTRKSKTNPKIHLKQILTTIPQLENYLTSIENISFNTSRILINQTLDVRLTKQELIQSQQTIQEEQVKLTTLLEGIKDGVIVINHSQEVVIINPAAAALTGMPINQAIGKPANQILILEDQNQPFTCQTYCTETQQTFFKENIKLIGPNHQLLFVNISVHKIMVHFQLGWIITLHNVTEEQQLSRMKLDFASMAAHELRTPLTTIQGYLSFLQTPQTLTKLNPTEQEFIAKAGMSTTRLNRLIENVLSVSKIEQGELGLTLQPVQTEKIIEKLITEYTGLAQTKDLKLIFTSPPTPTPMVMADSNKIEEVVSNLIGNAVKYSDRGYIEISIRSQGDFVITSITDTGKGIPSEAINKLFTKFFRVQGELKSGSKGTGLGLYISKTIIDSHGGKIWVESVVNQGSTFSFSLPIATQTPNPDTPTQNP